MWDNMQGERWFERLPDATGAGPLPDTLAARVQRHVTDWEVRLVLKQVVLLAVYAATLASGVCLTSIAWHAAARAGAVFMHDLVHQQATTLSGRLAAHL
jgi:hypothetical protein